MNQQLSWWNKVSEKKLSNSGEQKNSCCCCCCCIFYIFFRLNVKSLRNSQHRKLSSRRESQLLSFRPFLFSLFLILSTPPPVLQSLWFNRPSQKFSPGLWSCLHQPPPPRPPPSPSSPLLLRVLLRKSLLIKNCLSHSPLLTAAPANKAVYPRSTAWCIDKRRMRRSCRQRH